MKKQILNAALLCLLAAALLAAGGCAGTGSGGGTDVIAPDTLGDTSIGLMERYAKDAERFAENYPGVSGDNPFMFAEYEEVVELLERGTGILAFGFPT